MTDKELGEPIRGEPDAQSAPKHDVRWRRAAGKLRAPKHQPQSFNSLQELLKFKAEKEREFEEQVEKLAKEKLEAGKSKYTPTAPDVAADLANKKGISLLEAAALAMYEHAEPKLRADFRKEEEAARQAYQTYKDDGLSSDQAFDQDNEGNFAQNSYASDVPYAPDDDNTQAYAAKAAYETADGNAYKASEDTTRAQSLSNSYPSYIQAGTQSASSALAPAQAQDNALAQAQAQGPFNAATTKAKSQSKAQERLDDDKLLAVQIKQLQIFKSLMAKSTGQNETNQAAQTQAQASASNLNAASSSVSSAVSASVSASATDSGQAPNQNSTLVKASVPNASATHTDTPHRSLASLIMGTKPLLQNHKQNQNSIALNKFKTKINDRHNKLEQSRERLSDADEQLLAQFHAQVQDESKYQGKPGPGPAVAAKSMSSFQSQPLQSTAMAHAFAQAQAQQAEQAQRTQDQSQIQAQAQDQARAQVFSQAYEQELEQNEEGGDVDFSKAEALAGMARTVLPNERRNIGSNILGLDVYAGKIQGCLDIIHPDHSVTETYKEFNADPEGLELLWQWLKQNSVGSVVFNTHNSEDWIEVYDYLGTMEPYIKFRAEKWKNMPNQKLPETPTKAFAQRVAVAMRLNELEWQYIPDPESIKFRSQLRRVHDECASPAKLRRAVDGFVNRTHLELWSVFDDYLDPAFGQLVIKAWELQDDRYALEDYIYDNFAEHQDEIAKAVDQDLDNWNDIIKELKDVYVKWLDRQTVKQQMVDKIKPTLSPSLKECFEYLHSIPGIDEFSALSILSETGQFPHDVMLSKSYLSMAAGGKYSRYFNPYLRDTLLGCARRISEDESNPLYAVYTSFLEMFSPEKAMNNFIARLALLCYTLLKKRQKYRFVK